LDFIVRKKLIKCYIWSIALRGAEELGYFGKWIKNACSLEMWCWGRVVISWTDRVRNEEMLQRVIKERNIVQTINVGEANWIGYVLRRNCVLKDVREEKIKGRIKVTGRRGRRRAELLDYLKETRGFWKLKEEAVDSTVWGTGFGRGCGPVVRQTAV
jgi:hypothetical protein